MTPTGRRITNNQESEMKTIVTQSTEVERLAEEATRNRARLLRYYIAMMTGASDTKKKFRVPAKHLHLFYRGVK